MTRPARTLARLRADQRGYSLIEMLTVLTILGTIMGALTGIFVSASTAQVDMNARFQAQLQARLALDKLRREVHCASTITPTGPAASITLTLPTQCKTGSGSVTWCTASIATSRYGLYRKTGTTCNSSGQLVADYLTTATAFEFFAQSTSSLAKLRVTFTVDTKPEKTQGRYTLQDDIVLRNSTRT